MTHPSEENLIGAVTGEAPEGLRAHVNSCAQCRTRLDSWKVLAGAAREADRQEVPPLRVPVFDDLLASLPVRAAAEPVPAAVPESPRRTLRSVLPAAAELVRWQLRLLPHALGPVVFVLFVVGSLLALTTDNQDWGTTLFGACLNLAALIGALGVAVPERSPRAELFHTLHVPPATVFLARLVLVLALDVVAGLVTSACVGAVGGSSFVALLASWFGPSLLSASVALVVSLWRAPWLGGVAGFLLWTIGALSTRPQRAGASMRSDVGLGHVMSQVWSTNVWTVSTAVVLFACAALLVSRRRNFLARG